MLTQSISLSFGLWCRLFVWRIAALFSSQTSGENFRDGTHTTFCGICGAKEQSILCPASMIWLLHLGSWLPTGLRRGFSWRSQRYTSCSKLKNDFDMLALLIQGLSKNEHSTIWASDAPCAWYDRFDKHILQLHNELVVMSKRSSLTFLKAPLSASSTFWNLLWLECKTSLMRIDHTRSVDNSSSSYRTMKFSSQIQHSWSCHDLTQRLKELSP